MLFGLACSLKRSVRNSGSGAAVLFVPGPVGVLSP